MISLEHNKFKIELEFIGCINGSRCSHRYRFWDLEFRREPLFEGSDFSTGASTDPESFEAVTDLLGFFSCDRCDSEHVDKYTPLQLEWIDNWKERLEALKSWQLDLEETGWIAENLYVLSNDECDIPIDWDEWQDPSEPESEPCFPVRLRLFEDKFHFASGHPDFDTDHRGVITAGYLTEGMSEGECWNLLMELCDQCWDAEAVAS